MRFVVLLLGGCLTLVPGTSHAQLTLSEALREAGRSAFANRIAVATRDADGARARLPLKGILPTARIESSVIRTTDPIGAFGTTLRQRAVSSAAFDPARLNFPDAMTNVQSGVVLEVPLLNGDAWTGWRGARAAADASRASGDWTEVTTRTMVIRAYYGAILAEEKAQLLAQAQRASVANVKQVQSLVEQGLVTKADALQASVHAADIASQQLTAALDSQTAREQLALLLGRQDGSAPVLPRTLPSDSAVRALAERDTASVDGIAASEGAERARGTPPRSFVANRADVRAASSTVSAARADQQRAGSTLLPRVNSFARYDWNDPSTIYGGQRNWTVGVLASWTLFGGGSELADLAGAKARLATARAGEEATRAHAQLDVVTARRALVVALQRLDIATQSATQSLEAHRLIEKRYLGGLVTVAELLAAQTQSTASRLAQAAARYAVIDALASYRRATGADPGALTRLESAP